ncbi:MAG: response regulator transcription factor [Parasporobacterium sp.]|nr:response regulator transcription factor [Parasporobacterium sp.]
MRLLYAEDERQMSEAVVDILTFHKYTVDAVYDGEEALGYLKSEHYDGVILDVMMPKMSGIDVLKKMRAMGIHTPVLMLTAKSEIEDKIAGLDAGADDYLAKPFAMGEFLARVRALLRRREEFTPEIITYGNISLNTANYELCGPEQTFTLSKIEYQLMELLMINKGIYLSTDDLLTKVWGYETDAELGIVWVYISYLRKKLTALNADIEISAKRNIGYMLQPRNSKR